MEVLAVLYLLCLMSLRPGPGVLALKPLRTRKLSSDLLSYTNQEDVRRNLFDELVPVEVDPHGSWVNFVRHSENASHRRTHREKKEQKRLRGPDGPMGPPGPEGPPGPPGAEITTQDLMKEFRELVREEAERQAARMIDVTCQNTSVVLSDNDVEELRIIPRISAGFHHRLSGNVAVQRKTFLELKGFHRPFGGGAFQRGDVFDPDEGRFTSPRDGAYQFAVNLHIVHDGYRRGMPRRLKKRDAIRLLICIQSLCQKHTSLKSVSGLESNSNTFTMSVVGILYLEKDQYTSIYVDNGSAMHVTILEGSDFSGILMGV